ncbi:protein translocase subunit SecY [Rickettsiales bacterium]|nr:protein translocase subunit SecY [Rickettsiales bacterium]
MNTTYSSLFAQKSGTAGLSSLIELKNKFLVTILVLFVYRFGTYVPLPGVNPQALTKFSSQGFSGFLGMLNVFSGGALGRMTIFALNVMPYIVASIVMQLLLAAFSGIEALKKEGSAGRDKINLYTRYATIVFCLLHGSLIASNVESMHAKNGLDLVFSGILLKVMVVLTLTAGTFLLLWLGDIITSNGIGNGVSLIVFTSIVSELPNSFASIFYLNKVGTISGFVLLFILLFVCAVVFLIVFVEKSYRHVPVQYPKRQVGRKLFDRDFSHIPLKINTAGVIPAIFASTLLLMPMTVVNFINNDDIANLIVFYLSPGKLLYLVLYSLLIVFFCFFYTSIVFNADELADSLKKNGGIILGKRPGKNTATYLNYIVSRLTVLGSAYVVFVCIVAEVIRSVYAIPFAMGGTSLLIAVGVVIDIISQVQTHLFSYRYGSLVKKAGVRSRAG